MQRIKISSADGANAELLEHGAHLCSWQPAGGGQQLFISAKSEFGAGAAIRGGVPIIFPQFLRHGRFTKTWLRSKCAVDARALRANRTRAAQAVFELRKISRACCWAARLCAEYTVTLAGDTLQPDFSVRQYRRHRLSIYHRFAYLFPSCRYSSDRDSWTRRPELPRHSERSKRLCAGIRGLANRRRNRCIYANIQEPLSSPRLIKNLRLHRLALLMLWCVESGRREIRRLADMEGWIPTLCVRGSGEHYAPGDVGTWPSVAGYAIVLFGRHARDCVQLFLMYDEHNRLTVFGSVVVEA